MAKRRTKKPDTTVKRNAASSESAPRCGLCGKAKRLQQTECCGNWICDDEDSYRLFSFSRNSCSRNHRRYTLCGNHAGEEHNGTWQDCPQCRDEIETEMYVYYGGMRPASMARAIVTSRCLRKSEMAIPMTTCPGCGLELPASGRSYDRKFHASAECWALFEEVLAAEFQNPVLFGQVHQLTVDTYAVQHAGGRHPDKSVCIHLVGLYLVLERNRSSAAVAPQLQRLANRESWPHLDLPAARASLTVQSVARTDSAQSHALGVRKWAEEVWQAWAPHHAVARQPARELVGRSERTVE